MPVPSAFDIIEALADPGSFSPTTTREPMTVDDPDYALELRVARDRSAADESVVTGTASVGGHRVQLIVGDFDFLAGSIGYDSAMRVVRGLEYATAAGLPVIAAPVSGGTRMQEGTPAFLRMVAIAGAVAAHRARGLPYVVYLRHPTTGGVLATWGSLGQVTFAEPEALIGFLGPRVYEALHGSPFPTGVQTAENLRKRGIVDQVVAVEDLRQEVERLLRVVACRPGPRPEWATGADLSVGEDDEADTDASPAPNPPGRADGPRRVPPAPQPDSAAWAKIEKTRRHDRPGIQELAQCCLSDVVRLSGTGQGEKAPGLLVALARVGRRGIVLVGQDRAAQRAGSKIDGGSLRSMRRGMALAAELGLPFVSVVDTPGAELSARAEERALAGEIARTLADLTTLRVPTVSVLLGEGAGGAALAGLPADVVLAAETAWLTPLPPEGAAAIRLRDPDRAAEMAAVQRVTAAHLREMGAIDELIVEQGDWISDVGTAMGRAVESVSHNMVARHDTVELHPDQLHKRTQHWRNLEMPAL